MKTTLVVTLSSLALVTGCAGTIRLPGLSLGTQSSSSSSSSSAPAPSAFASPATKAWDAVTRQHHDKLNNLYYRATELPKAGSTMPGQNADRVMAILNDTSLDEVAKQCAAGAFKGEKTGKVYGEEYFAADTMCPVLVNHAELLKKALEAWALADMADRIAEQKRHVDDIAKTGRVYLSFIVEGESADQMKSYVSSFEKKYFEALGKPVPAEALKPIDDIVAQRQKTVLELALKGKIDRTAKADPGAEKAIREEYAGSVKGIQIKAVIMKDADWKLVKNEYGVLLRHYKDADLVVKAKDGSFCALVPASVGQPYEDNGRYAPQYGVDQFLQGYPVKCP